MAENNLTLSPRSRREFLGTTALAAGALGLPLPQMVTAAPPPAPRFRRRSVTDPAAKRSLDSYKKAIRAMLALPTTDPRNWYRYALIHTMDCPHGNWWFMPWHRGYIGWFETICRELSGDPEFALPYWDWTALPQVPDFMYDDVLTPSHPAYLGTYPEFQARFKDIVAKAGYWKRTVTSDGFDEDTQYGQLLNRGIRTADDLWFDIGDDPRGLFFFARAHARGLTRDAPQLDGPTAKAVSLQTLLDALSPRDFLTFGSARTFHHSGLTGFGVLEGLPHNRVHNCVGGVIVDAQGHTKDVGGFMQANLSPVDPLFFLHHSNIDRLWDLWTRKQQARGYPILPAPGPDFDMWSSEPFLFYIDAQGRPVGNASAGDYAAIGKFAYDYEPGSGEEVASDRGTPGLVGAELQTFRADIAPRAGTAPVLSGHVAVPAPLLERAGRKGGPTILAKITLALPPSGHHTNHVVLVNAPADAGAHHDSPHYAGTLSMFGHHTVHCPVTFTVPLSMPLLALGANKQLRTTEPLHIRVVPQPRHHRGAARRQGTAEVLAIVVESH